jgi:hypothetical protein
MLALGAMPIVPVRRPEVREDVAEQVAGHHHVEPVGVHHEVRGEDVDVQLVPAHLGVAGSDGGDPLIPVRHRDRDAVALGRRGEVLRRTPVGQFVGVLQDPVDAGARSASRRTGF